MFDLHTLADPVYSMAPKAAAPTVTAVQPSNSPLSFSAALQKVNQIHPLAGGADEFYQMMANPDQYAGPGGHQFMKGSPAMGENSATPGYYNDAIPNDQWAQIQQVLGSPMYSGGNAATSPMNQNASLGQTL